MLNKLKRLSLCLALCLLVGCLGGCSEGFAGMFGHSSIIINEVCTSNAGCLLDDELGTPDWIELYNSGSKPINLKDYALSNDIKSPAKYLLPEVTIGAGEYLIVYCSKLSNINSTTKPVTDFKLSASGTMLILTASGGDTLQKLDIPAMSSDQTYARDEKGDYRVSAIATPGKANTVLDTDGSSVQTMPDNAPVRITEFMVKNGFSLTDEQGDRSSWVEIYNSSSAPVSLAGYRLSDDADNPGKWSFPDVSIGPGQYTIIFCSGKNTMTASGELHANFRLSNNDVQVCLTDMTKMQMQDIKIPIGMAENISYGIQNGKWLFFGQSTPRMPNTTHGYEQMSDARVFNPSGLYISEVCAAQSYKSTALDWVELYNGSDRAINLNGYFLSDDNDLPQKAKLGSVTVPAKGYAVLTLSGNPNKQAGGVVPFGLSSSGETLGLFTPEGVPVDIFQTGVMRPGITSGRLGNDASGARVFFTTATRGTANPTSGVSGYAAAPLFSDMGGIKSGPVSVSIACATPGAKIYYTTNGATPNASSTPYTGPLTISTSTPLRAVAIASGLLRSEYTTATYLYTAPHSVPVVCLTMPEADFSTMYANSLTYVTIEREGHFSYYDENGTQLGVQFPAMTRVSGWSTRSYNQKSLTFKLDDALGQDDVNYPFFPGYDITNFAAITIRAGGQDRTRTVLRDAMLARLALNSEQADLDAPMNRYAVLYVNGKYWGLYDLREEIGKDMLASHHNVEPTSVNYLRRSVVQYGTNDAWKMMCAYARANNLNDPAKYAKFSEWVDVNAWADYLVFRNYFRETDMFNQKYWYTKDYKVKLRPIYFDNDYSLTSEGALSSILIGPYLTFAGYTTANGTLVNMDITAGLWTSSQFRNLFLQRWVLHSKTTFKPDSVIALLDSMAKEMEGEMPRQISRWGAPASLSTWRSELDQFRDLIRRRPSSARDLVRKNFSLTDAQLNDLYK